MTIHSTTGAASPRLHFTTTQRIFSSILFLLLLAFVAQLGSRSFSSDNYASVSSRLQPLRNLLSSHHTATRSSVPSDLTAHEWGTFTSIAGPDGFAMDWLPLTGSTELPSFIEHFRGAQFKGGLRGTVRMETPVLYFYSPRETTVSINVSFSKGLITEWYPHADSANPALTARDFSLDTMQSPGSISWNSVHIDPHASTDFPGDNSENHYYAARQTSSSPLELSTPSGMQREKFLFYRGVSAFLPPLTATLSSDNTVILQNQIPTVTSSRGSELQLRQPVTANTRLQPLRNPHPTFPGSFGQPTPNEIPNVILFERRGAQLGYRILGPLRDEAALAPPALDGSLEALSTDLEGILISQGLFPDEAHAMLETWKSSWFEEGSRLIYIVPRSFIDSVLPIKINPSPANTVRVFVGRLELVTPATQQAVESAFASGDGTTLAKYSRFLDPILCSMIQSSANDAARSSRLLKDLETASQLY